MSIEWMTHVWNNSKHKGSLLLMMLAIADYANESGKAWPGIESLAQRTRQTHRNALRIIEKLEKSGELNVDVRSSQYGTNLYTIQVDTTKRKRRIKNSSDILGFVSPKMSQDISGTQMSPDPSLSISKDTTTDKKKSVDTNGLYPLADAIASVCKMSLDKNRGLIFAEAKRLKESPDEVMKHYGPSGWWYLNDWRGKKGQAPRPAQIRETWGSWGEVGQTSDKILEFTA